MKQIKNLKNRTFGRLMVLSLHGRNDRRTLWTCLCSCGAITTKASSDLMSGKSNSCGCIRSEIFKASITKHGNHGSREYRAWRAMKQRCSPSNPRAKDYYNRGIYVCTAWVDSYVTFLNDVGRTPDPKLTLDRIDNDGIYQPGNVRWATHKQQRNNRRK